MRLLTADLFHSIISSTDSRMARKAVINLDDLASLGAERLARLVIDQSGRDAGFRKLVTAALAGAKGPKAVTAIVDRRLAALERAKSFIEWDRVKIFAADLDMTVKTLSMNLAGLMRRRLPSDW